MDKDRVMSEQKRRSAEACLLFFCSIVLLLFCSCSYTDIKREIQIPKEAQEVKPDRPPPSEPKMPDFIPVTEDISPLKTRIVDIKARNTPLRDVLYVISEATGLNLVMERDVNAETPITLTLKNMSAEDALNTIFSSVDYFYNIKDNMLFVKAVDTRIFELGHPAVLQTYSVDVGGDILGGATTGTTGGSNLKGNITQTTKNDTTAFNFWEAIEKSIASILGTAQPAAAPAGGTPATPTTTTTAVQQSYTVNRLTGTIVVTGSKKSIEKVERFLNTIKKVINRQVLVEAKIIEVQLSEGLKYGIDWTFVNKTLGDGQVSLTSPGFTGVVPLTSPYLNLAVTRGANFTSLIKALQSQGDVRTLSNPRVNIMNGQTALLGVGRNQSFISKVETTTTATGTTPTTTFTVTTSNILSGIMIGIVPYINENGEISLSITPIISDLIKLEDKTLGSGTNQTQISLPTVDLRELSTTVKVRDGQMVVIGGLISKKESVSDYKIPGLGDVPVVGEIFKNRDKAESRSELVIVLQPILVSR